MKELFKWDVDWFSKASSPRSVEEFEEHLEMWVKNNDQSKMQIFYNKHERERFCYKNKVRKGRNGLGEEFCTTKFLIRFEESNTSSWGMIREIRLKDDYFKILYCAPSSPNDAYGVSFLKIGV